LLRGTLDVLVLKALSWEPLHGFEITSWLEDRSDGHLAIDDGALYQAFHRMEERGWITAEWGMTENNRRARYYSLTREGRAALRRETARIKDYTRALNRVLAARNQ